jgi:hypothetical protein
MEGTMGHKAYRGNRSSKEQVLNQHRAKAEEIVRKHVSGSLPAHGSLKQGMVNEILHFDEFLKEAQRGRLLVVPIICAHCGKDDTKFISTLSKDTVSTYCSSMCRQSKLNNLPTGVVCRTPRKTAYASLEEAKEASLVTNTRINLEGDSQGVQPYECTCGKWHNGHKESEESLWWANATNQTITALTKKIVAIVGQ